MEILKAFTHPLTKKHGDKVSQWSRFLDGKIYSIELGKDVPCKTVASARVGLLVAARRRGLQVCTAENGRFLEVQASALPGLYMIRPLKWSVITPLRHVAETEIYTYAVESNFWEFCKYGSCDTIRATCDTMMDGKMAAEDHWTEVLRPHLVEVKL
jgi:hypothetical protein